MSLPLFRSTLRLSPFNCIPPLLLESGLDRHLSSLCFLLFRSVTDPHLHALKAHAHKEKEHKDEKNDEIECLSFGQEREREEKKKNRNKLIWGVTQHLQSRAAVISYLGK